MELRKKSLLIALTLGSGSLKDRTSKSNKSIILEVQHNGKRLEYLKWKADLCRKATGTLCNIKSKTYSGEITNDAKLKDACAYKFVSGHRYFNVLKKWLYPNNKKRLQKKYLKYLDLLGVAIWYMDNGTTYINENKHYCKFQGSCEFNLYTYKDEATEVMEYFKETWNLNFYLHKCKNNQYKIRCYNEEAVKFINMIKPFVPECMDYKVKIPEKYVHERLAS